MSHIQYRIQLNGDFSKKGFGFTCMHLTYDHHITGTLFYESSHSAILEMTGKNADILRVIIKLKRESFIDDIHILGKKETEKKSTDFIMLNQID